MELNYDAFLNRMFINAGANGVPLGGSFELTADCPLDCKMCYIHQKDCRISDRQKEKDTAWWLDLIKKAKAKGMLLVLLTGGEPLMRKDFKEIYIACKDSGFLVSVNTNGVLINDEIIALFQKYPPQRVNVTLYGTCAQTYKNLCGSESAFEKTVTAIKKLKNAGINVKLNYSVTPYNCCDCESALNFAKTQNLKIQPVTYMYPPINNSIAETRLCEEDAAKEHFLWQHRLLGDEDMLKYIRNLNKQQSGSPADADCGEKINCRAGLSTLWVTFDGYMLPCGMMSTPKIKIKDFDEAWQFIRHERENIILPKECNDCEDRNFCDMCAAVAYAETGEYGGVPRYACKKAKEYKKLCNNFVKNFESEFSGGNEK